MDQQTYALAETLWNYHLMKHQIAAADAILVLCSHDERVAERAAQLFHEGLAPLVIFSGGQGSITRTLWNEPEAERFAQIAINLGVPREKILTETQSTNTGENIEFKKRLLAERGLDLRSLSSCRSLTWNDARSLRFEKCGRRKRWSSRRRRFRFVSMS